MEALKQDNQSKINNIADKLDKRKSLSANDINNVYKKAYKEYLKEMRGE